MRNTVLKKKSRRNYFAFGRDKRKRARMRVCAFLYFLYENNAIAYNGVRARFLT